ncbi:hypothetical protein HYW74_02760 [Candidatus Pacearchaeota archaeon]|nr:hypothetical protein [Candidatus Pacearchaeota archaeon]
MKNYQLINTDNINEAKNLINKYSNLSQSIVVTAKNDEFNRKVLEIKKIDILLFRDFKSRKDKLKQRDSGLNQVLCKLAKENNILIGIDFNIFYEKNEKELSLCAEKMIQNIKLCNKYKVKIILFNAENKNKYDLFSLLISLGMPTNMAKETLNFNRKF